MELQLRINDVIPESIVDGPGIRYVIFTQGCPHHCPHCHNPQTHDFAGGCLKDINDLYDEIIENPLLQGVTFSGGEPFLQPKPLTILAKKLKQNGLDVVTYTGFIYESLKHIGTDELDLLAVTDVLIDGAFDYNKRDASLKFRGSANQRIIDLHHGLQ